MVENLLVYTSYLSLSTLSLSFSVHYHRGSRFYETRVITNDLYFAVRFTNDTPF